MAYCRNCGNEIPEGSKFCSNCGTAIEIGAAVVNSQVESKAENIKQAENEKFYTSDVYSNSDADAKKKSKRATNKLGKLFVLILIILAIVDMFSDPPALTIVLSVAIIIGCIFCFAKKYKLKGFTIMALLLSVLCLVSGINQTKKYGLFAIPEQGNTKIVATKSVEAPTKKSNTSVTQTTTNDNTKKASTTNTTETKQTVNGVDPELKAFLDSYEDFMDEYVDFMKKYMADPGNAVSMLSEYSQVMSEYEKFAKAIDAYDSKEMSTEDAKYYLDVVNRCNKKMLEIY